MNKKSEDKKNHRKLCLYLNARKRSKQKKNGNKREEYIKKSIFYVCQNLILP